MTSRKFAKSIANFASDKKAEDILILDMRKIVNFCDYFVLCSGNTDRQVKAIADHLDDELKKMGQSVLLKEGTRECSWVVYDIGSVITHIFQKKTREFYQLEHLWQEAKQVKWP